MATPPTPIKCPNCHSTFANKQNKERHLRQGKCQTEPTPDFLPLIKSEVFFSESLLLIVKGLGNKAEQFKLCQTMGLFYRGLFPLIFNFDRNETIKALGHFTNEEESTSALLEILKVNKGSPIFLKKDLILHLEKKIDLGRYTYPKRKSNLFDITDSKGFVKIQLKLCVGTPSPSPTLLKVSGTPSPSFYKKVSELRISSPLVESTPNLNLSVSYTETHQARLKTVKRDIMKDFIEPVPARSVAIKRPGESIQYGVPKRQCLVLHSVHDTSGNNELRNNFESRGSVGPVQQNRANDNPLNASPPPVAHAGDVPDGGPPGDDPPGGNPQGENLLEENALGVNPPGGDPPGDDPPGGDPPGGDPAHNQGNPDEEEDSDPEDLEAQQRYIKRKRTQSKQTYKGFRTFNKPRMKHKQAREELSVASSSIQTYLSHYHMHEVVPDSELKYMTGLSSGSFNDLCLVIGNTVQRVKKLTHGAKVMLYTTKMRKGTPNREQGFNFNVSEKTAQRIWWDCASEHYLKDRQIPYRNYDIPNIELPTAEEILEANKVDDPFIRAIFQSILDDDEELVIWCGDHTYIFIPKLGVAAVQRSTYFKPKKDHVVKFFTLCNIKGKVVAYSPMSSSSTPDSGDGNLMMITLENEIQGHIPDRLNRILKPVGGRYRVFSFFDSGYTYNIGNRREGLTLEEYYNNPNLQGHDPRHRYFSINKPGEDVLDANFDRIPNRHPLDPANPRTNLTCAEADTMRVTTLCRGRIEQCFAGVKQNRILDQRTTDFHFLDKMGDLLDKKVPNAGLGCVPKLEVTFHNCLSNYNKDHRGFGLKWEPPTGHTYESLAANLRHRLGLGINPFDTIEGVEFSKDFKSPYAFPTRTQNRDWNKCSIYNTEETGFPMLNSNDMTEVTFGSYQIKNNRMYVTDMVNKEFRQWFENLTEEEKENMEMNFDEYDTLMSGLPIDKDVYWHDELREPTNWPREQFGPWPRTGQRWVFCTVPSAHAKGEDHKVIIAFIPSSAVENEDDIVNPLGLRGEGFRRIVGWGCFSKRCKVGFRQVGCCSHIAALMIFLGCYAYQPGQFKNLYRPVHKLDIRNPVPLNRQLHGGQQPNLDEQEN